MNRTLELAAFAAVALGLHLGAWVAVEAPGSEGQGASGEASVSLVASTAAISKMVAAWSRPVDAVQDVSPLSDVPEQAVPAAFQPPAVQPAVPRPSVSQPPQDAALPQPLPQVEPPLPPRPALQDRLPQTTPPPLADQSLAAPRQQALAPRPAVAAPTVAPPTPAEALPQVDRESPRSDVLDRAPKVSERPAARPEHPSTTREAAAQSAQQSTAAPSQKAKGGTTGKNAGNARTERSASLSKAARQNLMAQWGASIRNRIERRKRYPAGVTARGTTVLRITVTRAGRLAGVVVVKSSGHPKLDRAAVAAVKGAGFPAAPNGLTEAQYRFNLPIGFGR